MPGAPNKMNRDNLSKKAKRIAQNHAGCDLLPSRIWVRPAPNAGRNRYNICYRLAGRGTVVVDSVVYVPASKWERYCLFQEQFTENFREKVAKPGFRAR